MHVFSHTPNHTSHSRSSAVLGMCLSRPREGHAAGRALVFSKQPLCGHGASKGLAWRAPQGQGSLTSPLEP